MDRNERLDEGEPRHYPPTFIEKFLANPTRAKIMEILEREPGMNKHQLSKTLGVQINASEFHIRRMVEVGLIELKQSLTGRELLCFRAEDADLWDDPPTRVLYGRSPRRKVAVFLAENPGADAQKISKSVGLSIHKVRRHVKTLEDNELVQRLRVDRHVYYHAEPALTKWFEDTMEDRQRNKGLEEKEG